ncbi:hypothetical protein Q8A67_022439 [Cirrhinus molitorella]|uniref:Uncharacterized protein n=1 Tax=Cirrhinus molitorella TaxID=172907 RepID=A0AA88P1V6_9TELE|nr:hypothetical protein Q8A67_022439 [Cirrhinus molitorella]
MMVRQSGSETREGLCSEGTLLVRGALKLAAFDLLEMPQDGSDGWEDERRKRERKKMEYVKWWQIPR